MTHGTTPIPKPRATGKARAIAELSTEWLDADAPRRDAIGEEIQGIIDGKIEPIGERK